MKSKARDLFYMGTLILAGLLVMPSAAHGALLLQYNNEPSAAGIAALGAFVIFGIIVGLGAYIYFSLALQTIAKKTNTPNGWLAWIPIANLFLMLNISKKPLWWFILLLIPLVNLIFTIIVWMGIAEARNKPNWWGIMLIVPLVNIIVPGYLAWAD